MAIVGEAKGSVEDPGWVIDDTRERIIVAKDNKDYMNRKYIEARPTVYEYVLGVNSIDSLETSKSIVRKGGGLILWHAERSDEPRLSLAVPETKDQRIRQSVMHSDQRLNKALDKVRTATEVFTFFQQSHLYSKMLILTMVKKGVDGNLTFSYQDVKEFVAQTLPYVDTEIVERETGLIIPTAEKIGFIRKSPNGTYKIVSRHRSSSGLEDDLKKRWLTYKMSEKLEEKISEAIEKVQTEFTQKRGELPTLEKFQT